MQDGIERKAVVFYRSFYEAISDLDSEEFKTAVCAILEYGLNGREPEHMTGAAGMFFKMAKPQIDANNMRYLNGQKGGRPKTKHNQIEPDSNQNKLNNNQIEPSNNQCKPKEKDKEKEKDKVKDKVKSNDNTSAQTPENGTDIFMELEDGSFYDVLPDKLSMWQRAYPDLDVERELYQMASWCDANPTRRKTRRGIEKFINGWLNRSQNDNKQYSKREEGKNDAAEPEEDKFHVSSGNEIIEELMREGLL